MVLINKYRNVGILVSGNLVKTKYIGVVQMSAGELTTTSMRREKFEEEEWREFEYPLEKAIMKFLEHSSGVSESTRRSLETLAGAL